MRGVECRWCSLAALRRKGCHVTIEAVGSAAIHLGVLARLFLADALNKNGAIGEYSVMKKFTDKLGGQVQAHHLLEQKFVKKFALGEADRVPSVILTDAEHKAITAKLKIATAHVETPQQLWQAYQDAYVDHPSWLAAIKSYFFKAK